MTILMLCVYNRCSGEGSNPAFQPEGLTRMKPTVLLYAAFMLIVAAPISRTAFATVPFTENFASSVSNWTTGGGTPSTFQTAGGPDGSSYASVTFTLANIPYSAPIVMLR